MSQQGKIKRSGGGAFNTALGRMSGMKGFLYFTFVVLRLDVSKAPLRALQAGYQLISLRIRPTSIRILPNLFLDIADVFRRMMECFDFPRELECPAEP